MHIINKIEQHQRQSDDPFYLSFEYFPPKTESGVNNLLDRMDRMCYSLKPLFVDITVGDDPDVSLDIAAHVQKYSGVEVLLHLTILCFMNESCSAEENLENLKIFLKRAEALGIQNLLVLRGQPNPKRKQSSAGSLSDCNTSTHSGCKSKIQMEYSIDLLRFIKKEFGDSFCLAVAGHPEGHEQTVLSLSEEVVHLKHKVEAGADFIITQFFYDIDVFVKFVKKCREVRIQCPIIPGIMPIQSYVSFQRMTKYCGTTIPPGLMKELELIKNDDEAVKAFGCQVAVTLCKELILKSIDNEKSTPLCEGLHFYTLNLERSVTLILNDLFENFDNPNDKSRRQFPWRQSVLDKRMKEDVRPINWANRPKSYLLRTDDWDEFPNGRWGDSTSPAFGELSDSHFYSYSMGSDDDRRAMLGYAPCTEKEIYDVFAGYVEGVIPYLPWCEISLQSESFVIQKELAQLNRQGFLTVNSQPSVNGKPSDDPVFGWGGKGGYIYQKAYVECFVSPENLEVLLKFINTKNYMCLYAVNINGEQRKVRMDGVTALTWGVFPNKEVLQPTIFDPATFLVWAEEAFLLWQTLWQNLYDFGSESWELLNRIRETYFLVAIVDNNFVNEESDALWKTLLQIKIDSD